jgi:hypothetical protein
VDCKFLNFGINIEKALKFHGLKMHFFQSHNIVHLYIVFFEEDIVEVFEEEDEDEDGGRVGLNDRWWHDKISGEEDLFDVNVDDIGGGARPSKIVPNRSECQEGEQDRNERGDDDGCDQYDNDEREGDEDNYEGEGSEDNDGREAAVDEDEKGNISF